MELLHAYISEFDSNRKVILQLLSDLPEDMIHWKKTPEKWSLLEIISHLYDEEREDFRARLASILEDPGKKFISIDPQGWVSSRHYAQNDFSEMMSKFSKERDTSIAWLKTLENASWNNTAQHPRIGPMPATFMIANWLAHDHLHIRQILKTKYDYWESTAGENLQYAGGW